MQSKQLGRLGVREGTGHELVKKTPMREYSLAKHGGSGLRLIVN